MTLFKVLTGGAFDRLNWQYSGEFDQNFSKSQMPQGLPAGGMGGFGIDRYITVKSSEAYPSRSHFENREQLPYTQAVPLVGSIFKILPARGTRSQKTENITRVILVY